MELTILTPCLNEAETLAACIQKAYRLLDLPGVLIWWPSSGAARGNNGLSGYEKISRRV